MLLLSLFLLLLLSIVLNVTTSLNPSVRSDTKRRVTSNQLSHQTNNLHIVMSSSSSSSSSSSGSGSKPVNSTAIKRSFRNFLSTSLQIASFLQFLVYFAKPVRDDVGSGLVLHFLVMIGLGINWFIFFIHGSGFFTSSHKPSERYYDLTGSVTFFGLSAIALFHNSHTKSVRQIGLTVGIWIWCFRLGTFLFSRIVSENGIDSRFVQVKEDVWRFASYWSLQGVWCIITSLPVLSINAAYDPAANIWTVRDTIGVSLYVIGIVMETVADNQKRLFRLNKSNHGKFISTGLWSISRHPNYFGEILVWLGVFLVSSSSFIRASQYLTIASPLLVAFLLIFVSGIPLLEKASDKKFGSQQAYNDYKGSTPVLIPFVGNRGDAKF